MAQYIVKDSKWHGVYLVFADSKSEAHRRARILRKTHNSGGGRLKCILKTEWIDGIPHNEKFE